MRLNAEAVAKYLLVAGIITASLIYNPLATEPFLLYKELTFRSLVLFAATFFIWRTVSNRRGFAFNKSVFVSTFPIWCFFAFTFFSYQLATNTHEVAEEQIRLLYLLTFFVMVSSLSWDKKNLSFFFWIVSLSGVLVSVLGILEAFYIYPLYGIKERILSLFGYPNLVAQFLLIAMTIQLGFFFLLTNPFARGLNGLSFVISGTCFFLTYCRSAWLAFVIVAVFLIFYFFKASWLNRRKFLAFAVFALLVFASSAVLFFRDFQWKENRVIQERVDQSEAVAKSSLRQLDQLTQKEPTTGGEQISLPLKEQVWLQTKFSKLLRRGDNGRFDLWVATLKMIRSAPLFGVGAGNYFVEYPRYSNGRDKMEFVQFAHNDYLQLWAEFGVVGILLLGLWFVLITARGFLAVRTAPSEDEAMMLTTLLAVTLAIGIDAFFSYDWYMTVPAMFLWFVWGVFQSRSKLASETENVSLFSGIPGKIGQFLKMTALIVSGAILFYAGEGIYREAKTHMLFGESHRQFGAGKIENAVSLMRKVIEYKPKNARYHYVLSTLYIQQRQFEKALEQLEITKSLTPHVFITNLSLALTNYVVGRYELATKQFRDLAEQYKDDEYLQEQYLTLLNDYANDLTRNGEYAKAIENYELILKQNPNLSAVYYNLGNIYAQTEKFDQALAPYEKAYQIDPKRFLIVFKLGLTNQLLNRTDEAIRFYREAISLDPKNYQPYLNLGILLLEQNDSEGVDYLKRSLELEPNQPQKELINQSIQTGKFQKSR